MICEVLPDVGVLAERGVVLVEHLLEDWGSLGVGPNCAKPGDEGRVSIEVGDGVQGAAESIGRNCRRGRDAPTLPKLDQPVAAGHRPIDRQTMINVRERSLEVRVIEMIARVELTN